VVTDQAGEALETLLPEPERAVERVKAVSDELGRVADVVKVSGREQHAAIADLDRRGDLLRAHGNAARVSPPIPEWRKAHPRLF
jgi:hypothetical protein